MSKAPRLLCQARRGIAHYAPAWAVCGAVSLFAASAEAHAPPYGIALFFANDAAASEPTVLTNRGLIFKTDGSFRLRCNAAYGAGTAENTAGFQEPGSNRLVVRGFSGVFSSEDSACTFTRATNLTSDPIGGFAPDSALSRVLVSSLNYAAPSGLMLSSDHARSFSALPQLAASSAINTLLVAPSDSQRVYAGGARYDLVQSKLVNTWLVSDDGGSTFRSTDVEFPRTPLAVHPTNKNIVFVGDDIDDLAPEAHLLRSSDGGNSFSTVLETTTLLSFASNADGSRMWLGAGLGIEGSKRGGLFSSADQGLTFTPALDQVNAATCLLQRGDRLWLCGNLKPNEGGIWYSDDQFASLTPYLTFEQVLQQVDCPSDANDADGGVCKQLWSDWVYEQTGGLGLDGGVGSDGGVSADGGVSISDAGRPSAGDAGPADAEALGSTDGSASPNAKKHGGCSVSPGAGTAHSGWFGLLLAGLGVRRRLNRRARAAYSSSPARAKA